MSTTFHGKLAERGIANTTIGNKSRRTRHSFGSSYQRALTRLPQSQALLREQSSTTPEELIAMGGDRVVKAKIAALESTPRIETSETLHWWKMEADNFKCVATPEELVSQIINAANFERQRDGKERLVVVEFFSTSCGACRALGPKLKQIAEQNPNVTFLKFNYGDHAQLCRSIDVRVLPLLQFYKGAELLDRFACSLQPGHLKKLRRALEKNGAPSCAISKPPLVDFCADDCVVADDLKVCYHDVQMVLEHMSSARHHIGSLI